MITAQQGIGVVHDEKGILNPQFTIVQIGPHVDRYISFNLRRLIQSTYYDFRGHFPDMLDTINLCQHCGLCAS